MCLCGLLFYLVVEIQTPDGPKSAADCTALSRAQIFHGGDGIGPRSFSHEHGIDPEAQITAEARRAMPGMSPTSFFLSRSLADLS
jgi:hypothetical protein